MMSEKLDRLVASEGYANLVDLLSAVICDAVSPGICMNGGCDYMTEVEPDQDRGYCENCGTNSVKSALVLAELI
jgi:hypothetical protein